MVSLKDLTNFVVVSSINDRCVKLLCTCYHGDFILVCCVLRQHLMHQSVYQGIPVFSRANKPQQCQQSQTFAYLFWGGAFLHRGQKHESTMTPPKTEGTCRQNEQSLREIKKSISQPKETPLSKGSAPQKRPLSNRFKLNYQPKRRKQEWQKVSNPTTQRA